MRKKSLVHVIAECKNCDKHWEDYMTGWAKARRHAKRTGHHVVVELGYIIHYNEEKKDEGQDRNSDH